jgi:hypothetical protein
MVVPVLIATVGVARIAGVVSTGFRLKRRLLHHDSESQAAHHVIEHVIVTVAQPAIADLQGHVSIAEVICRARKPLRILAMHVRDSFRGRADFDDPSIVGEQQISPAQDLSAFQNNSDLFAVGQAGAKTASAANIKWQHQLCIR